MTQITEAVLALSVAEQKKLFTECLKANPALVNAMTLSVIPEAMQSQFFERNARYIQTAGLEAILTHGKMRELSDESKLAFAGRLGLTVLRRRTGGYNSQTFTPIGLPYYMRPIFDELSNVASSIENANNALVTLRSNKDAVIELLRESLFTTPETGLNAQCTALLRTYRRELSSALFFARMSPAQIQRYLAQNNEKTTSDGGNSRSSRQRRIQTLPSFIKDNQSQSLPSDANSSKEK